MAKKEVATGLGVYTLWLVPLVLYAVTDPANELKPENKDKSAVSQSPSVVLMPKRLNRKTSECLDKYSCLGASLTPFGVLKCNCDDLCELYDDCCHDYNRSSFVEGALPSPELIDCVALSNSRAYTFSYRIDVFIVTRCPEDYGDKLIREWCESSDDEFNSQPVYRLPVNGRKSKVLYRNWYCAVCNRELDVVFWEVWKLKGSPSEDVRRTPGSDPLTNDSEVFYFENPDDFSPRQCLKSVRKCAENWTDQETAMRCEDRLQATAYVKGYEMGPREWRIYRNPDCATCNYVEESKTVCFKEKLPPNNPASLSLLFVGMANVLPECDLRTMSAKICRPILCAVGSRSENGRSTTINATMELLSLTESLNCNIVQLNASEFTTFDNQSLFVHKTGSIHDRTEYVIHFDYVCICLNLDNKKDVIPFQFDSIQGILSSVGSIISLTSLFLQFVVYLIFPVLRNVPGKCVMCLVLSLFSAHLLFLFVSNPGPVCFYLSAAMHFAFLASFCWMNVLSIDICRTFASKMVNSDTRSTSKHFVIYSLYSWTLPAAITGICLILDIAQVDDRIRPHYGLHICWITNPTALLVFFLVPVALLLTANFVLFSITACALRRFANDSRMAAKNSTSRKARLWLHTKLSIIMGLPWVIGYVGYLTQWTVIWYLFIIFNTMQCTFLCVSFVCTKRVFRLMRDCSPWGRSSISSSNENEHGRTQTDSV